MPNDMSPAARWDAMQVRSIHRRPLRRAPARSLRASCLCTVSSAHCRTRPTKPYSRTPMPSCSLQAGARSRWAVTVLHRRAAHPVREQFVANDCGHARAESLAPGLRGPEGACVRGCAHSGGGLVGHGRTGRSRRRSTVTNRPLYGMTGARLAPRDACARARVRACVH